MSILESAIAEAYAKEGNSEQANKAYLEFIKANFIIPVEKDSGQKDPEVLFLVEEQQIYLPVFTDMTYFKPWAEEISEQIELLKLSGVDLLKGIGDEVTVCLNIGSPYYKEFNASELARMRSMVLKFFS